MPSAVPCKAGYLTRLLPDGIRQPIAEAWVLSKINMINHGVGGAVYTIPIPATNTFVADDFYGEDFY